VGCITSRKEWPPKPPKRPVVRTEQKMVLRDGKWVSELVQVVDYTIDWPSLRCSGSSRDDTEEKE
jgi:hypothetical protein